MTKYRMEVSSMNQLISLALGLTRVADHPAQQIAELLP